MRFVNHGIVFDILHNAPTFLKMGLKDNHRFYAHCESMIHMSTFCDTHFHSLSQIRYILTVLLYSYNAGQYFVYYLTSLTLTFLYALTFW